MWIIFHAIPPSNYQHESVGAKVVKFKFLEFQCQNLFHPPHCVMINQSYENKHIILQKSTE